MKNFSCFVIFILLNVLSYTVIARTGGISGRVLDAGGQPLAFANVILLHEADSALVKTELTNENGEFVLTLVADGAYLVKAIRSGYDAHISGEVLISGNNVAVPDLRLTPKASELKETTVRAQKPFIEVHPDKIVVNVENSIVSAGGSVMDVLTHSPGVTVDQNDNISLKGKQGVNVMINGKIQPMSSDDLANMLKSMPSNSVESIELISNPSAKYDAAGTAGIINIKMKKDNKVGLNGTVNTTYAQGVYGKENVGFSMNYRNKKYNFFASYNHSDRNGFNHLTLQRNFYTNGTFSGAYNQDNNFLYHVHSNMASLGMDYNVSSKTTIGFVLNGDAYLINRLGNNHSDVIDSATRALNSQFTTASNSHNNRGSYAANVNLRHKFDSSGKTLSIDADYAGYPGNGTQDYTTAYYDAGGLPTGASVILHGNLTGLTRIRSLKGDYVSPLKDNAKIEAGIKTSYVSADNNPAFYDVVNNTMVADAGKTDHFIYNETINAGYINYSKDWTKWGIQAGLRAEQTVATGKDVISDSGFKRNYINLFPSMAVQRHIDKDNDLGITLSRRIERPNYQQLNPFKSYLDPTTYSAGYPYLNPALSYSAELSHTFKQRLVTTLSYIITTDPITEVIQPSETESKVTVQTTKNLSNMYYYGASGSYQFRFFKWWNSTTNVNVYYAKYTGDIAGTMLDKGAVTGDINITNSFVLPKDWSAEISGFYQAPQVYGYMDLKPSWMLNAGVQKNLFNKRATIRINATDIFWHGYPRATSNYNNYVESFVAQRDTRQVSLSLTWRFGKRTIPPSQRHNGGAEDEKKRVGEQAG